jgi:predicted ATPase
MIETLSLRNFKVLREVDVRLRPLTLVVGPNASGNGTFGVVHKALADRGVFSSVVPDGLLSVRCSGRYAGKELAFDLSIEPSDDWPYQIRVKWGDREVGSDFGSIIQVIRPASLMSLDVRRLAARSLLKETNQALPSSGEGLSTILADLYLEHPDHYRELVGRLREVIPVVRSLRVRRTPDGYELLFDMLGAEGVPASSVSEGTLLTLALLTLLMVPNPPQLVLIDDLERGLHPGALGNLVKQFRAIQQQSPELQIVATSHSPYLLDYLNADEILLTSLGEDGYAAVKPLTDHPEYDRWKDVMAPGEFWSTVGERWITEPAAR